MESPENSLNSAETEGNGEISKKEIQELMEEVFEYLIFFIDSSKLEHSSEFSQKALMFKISSLKDYLPAIRIKDEGYEEDWTEVLESEIDVYINLQLHGSYPYNLGISVITLESYNQESGEEVTIRKVYNLKGPHNPEASYMEEFLFDPNVETLPLLPSAMELKERLIAGKGTPLSGFQMTELKSQLKRLKYID